MFFIIVLFCCSTSVFADLYITSDPLVILNSGNFYQQLLESKNGWIIQFYNSWCGHCIGFAPTWKNFSSEVKDWAHTFKVGVIDCSDEENIPICRDYEVMEYPSVRIFGSLVQKGDTGSNVDTRSIAGLQTHIVDFILEKQSRGESSDSWVNLLPYNQSFGNLFQNAPSEAQHAVLIVESGKQVSSGSYTILDLGKYPTVYIRRTTEDGTGEISRLGLSTYPAVIIATRDGKREIFTEKVATREEMTNFIIGSLKLGLLDAVKKSKKYGPLWFGRSGTASSRVDKDDREGAGDGEPDEISSDRLSYDDELPDSAFRHPNKDQVYMVDMENAISYALTSEIALHQLIDGDHLSAFKEFLNALVDFLPARPQVHQFLLRLRNYVAKVRSLTAGELEKKISFLTSPSSILPDLQPWIGCEGSKPHYRGYPCGLWTLFHTLTVNALLTSQEKASYDPHRPLSAIHEYVKYFFSCRDCSKHFQKMYALDAQSSVRAPNDEVLWLWNAHNKANKRLKGELSEDPNHPKIQFPSKASCATCWTDDGLNRDKVLLYLKRIYGRGSISLEGTQDLTRERTSDNKQTKVIYPSEKLLDPTVKNMDQSITSKNIANSWNLNTMDVNLCILLYFSSTVIIACGYLMFILKRKLRRKKYTDLYKLP